MIFFNNNNIPLLMVVAFLVLTLVVGLYYSRKTTTLREYAVGNKQFATATLVATVLATRFGGGTLIRTIESVHNDGLYWIIIWMLSCSNIWIISKLAIRMGPFMQHLSMVETIGSIYGRYPKIITTLASICSAIAAIAGQITVMSKVISMCLEQVDPKYITIGATFILIFYSTFGGIRAVTFTDVLQFITFTIVIPFLAWFMFKKVGAPVAESFIFLQSQEKFQFSSVFHFDTKLVAMIALLLSNLMANIQSTTIQRVYMSSSPIQAKKVFLYSSIFGCFIVGSIILISLFVFTSVPALPKEKVWPYIMGHIPPFFQGFVCISLLAMAMSTADSYLNVCAVMVSHDMVGNVRGAKIFSTFNQLWLAKLTSVIVGLFAMRLAFECPDLLHLLTLMFDCSIPIITAPFILAIFGFRGTSRTALIGMTIGVLTIVAWNTWIKPATGININGAFPCMLANGLAMLAAHYLLPQPEGTGWIEPDDEFKQIKQSKERASQRRNAAIKAAFVHKKNFLATLKPNDAKLIGVGIYIMIISFMSLGYHWNDKRFYLWPLLPPLIGVSLIGYTIFSYKRSLPDWIVGSYLLLGLCCCLTIHSLYSWGHMPRPLLMLILSLTHFVIILWGLPLWTGLLVAMPFVILYPLFCLQVAALWSSSAILFPLLGLGMVLFVLAIYAKHKLTVYEEQIDYFKDQQKLKQEQKLKNIAFNLNMHAKTASNDLEEDGAILQKVVKDVTQSISFLDDHPLYKQDFQSIINKFSEWALFLKKQAKSKDHILLQPTAITLDDLINQVEIALVKEMGRAPRLLIAYQDHTKTRLSKLTCDVNQVIHLLVTAIKTMADLDLVEAKFLRIQFHTTHLQYDQNEATEQLIFPAVALVISHSTAHPSAFPKVKNTYKDGRNDAPATEGHSQHPLSLDFSKKAIERIIRAHYGYLEIPHSCTMLIVLPWNVTTIREEIMAKLPMEMGTSETAITPKEQADSMMALIDFHAYVSQAAYVDPRVVAEILLLLRRCYGFKRHASGQLFYVRAVGIAQLVATWIFHAPKPIYAALLYDLVRYTRLPLSYIKANYDMGIFCFVENILSVDKREALEQSLLYIHNRLKNAIQQEQCAVLYIKLAERLYDLRHAAGYTNLEEVKYMVKETLAVDIKLAKQYLEPCITRMLETEAAKVLEYYKDKTGMDV